MQRNSKESGTSIVEYALVVAFIITLAVVFANTFTPIVDAFDQGREAAAALPYPEKL